MVTIARKVGDYWYNAIVNGSSNIHKFELSNGQLTQIPYDRYRQVDRHLADVVFVESIDLNHSRRYHPRVATLCG